MYPCDDTVRYIRGSACPGAKLDEGQAREIYQLWRLHRHEWGIQSFLAKRFRVSPSTISQITRGRVWREATVELRRAP